MKKLVFLLAPLLAVSPAQGAERPDLLVAISVDQLSSDLFEEYAPYFTGGLKRLSGGVAYLDGFQAHAATETCPGHSTILTGAHPSRNGVVANGWGDLSLERANKVVYCAEDEAKTPDDGQPYVVSPVHLLVPTLGERMKAANPASRNVAVAGKDRSAVMMGGHAPDQRWFWGSGGFTTDLAGGVVPASVPAVSKATLDLVAKGAPALVAPPLCAARMTSVAVPGGSPAVGDGTLAIPAGDMSAFTRSPAYDGAVLALAAALVREMRLGKGEAPDILSVGLSATDYVGHKYGPGGGEMCLQMLALDRQIGDFLAFLDNSGIDYEVVLTADHGGLDIPERDDEGGARRVDPAALIQEANRTVAADLGLPFMPFVDLGEIYADPRLTDEQRGKAIAAMVAALKQSDDVFDAYDAQAILAAPAPTGHPSGWSPLQRVRASYYPGRSGDIVVVLDPKVTPIADTTYYISTHGSAWDYDRRVPILFWRKGMEEYPSAEPAMTVDIMPTLAATIGLEVDPAQIDGTCLVAVAGPACPGN
ncbi:alkaline phosphatase family protein [Sphingomicrobium nitratireducens]|uniref:alkaline phosphatase family protein n=1 Tax=Sphingomicrobium nitratireducens TaxID=2964666 RepID=UPI00224092FA|nr:alkaline phosphatase family protein [Sphingomicrobium nitratireducens]